MEERKLIRLGNSSFAIALPKDWIDKAGLKKGDKVFILPNSNGELMISPEFKKTEGKKIEISLEKDAYSIKKNLQAAYTKGYDYIIFKKVSNKNRKIPEELIRDFLGFEIIESNEQEIIAKDFFDITEVKYESFVKRIDNNLREMFDIVIKSIIDPSKNPIKEIEEIDKNTNKFYFLCSRLFIKGIDNPALMSLLKMNGGEFFNNWWISFNSESLGDGLKYVSRWFNKLKPTGRESILKIIRNLKAEHIKLMDAFYANNFALALEVIDETKKLKAEIIELEEKNPAIYKITSALELVAKNVYQNAKMAGYLRI